MHIYTLHAELKPLLVTKAQHPYFRISEINWNDVHVSVILNQWDELEGQCCTSDRQLQAVCSCFSQKTGCICCWMNWQACVSCRTGTKHSLVCCSFKERNKEKLDVGEFMILIKNYHHFAYSHSWQFWCV